jgi:hypothetical protein
MKLTERISVANAIFSGKPKRNRDVVNSNERPKIAQGCTFIIPSNMINRRVFNDIKAIAAIHQLRNDP